MTTKKAKKILRKYKAPAKKVATKKVIQEKSKIMLMPDEGGALTYVDFALKAGALQDPPGKSGVSSLTLSMMLRGTKKRDSEEFHRLLDDLGAEIHLGKYKESMRIFGVVLTENLPALMDLMEEMILEPRFAPEEFQKVKEQFHSALLDELSSDDDIAERRFTEYFLWGHPYGRSTSGSLSSIKNITLEDVKQFYASVFCASPAVFSATGAFKKAWMQARMNSILKKMNMGDLQKEEIMTPLIPARRHLLLLDKPDRTQSQVIIGAKGVSFTDRDYLAMVLANHVFGGGSFSARLMKEVREKRGWSYGAYSWFRSGKKPLYFAMQTVPSNKDTVPAVKLMLELYENFAKKGLTKQEFDFAKKSLVSQSAFMQDTLRKRMDNKVSEEILGLPKGFYDSYVKRLKRLTYAQVQKAIRKHVEPKNIFILVLCTVAPLKKEFETIAGVKEILVKRFDEEPPEGTS